ncbi:hypothetical protein GGR51DRAFT_559384 [Nemania sp. FL0031]|nr:hypothetical protein GGR51DRAFT_559384 [Nemania sp. FL0031]
MKPSALFNVIFIGRALAAKTKTTYPAPEYPSLQNGIACYSSKLTISYTEGFTTETFVSGIPPPTTHTNHFYPPSRNPTLSFVTTTLPTSTSTSTSTPTPTTPSTTPRTTPSTKQGRSLATPPPALAPLNVNVNAMADAGAPPSVSAEAEKTPGHQKRRHFTCSFLPGGEAWKTKFLVPKWLPTSRIVTGRLNTWITTTPLTTIDTEYWESSIPLAMPLTQPPVPALPMPSGGVWGEVYDGPEDEDDDDDDNDIDTVSYPTPDSFTTYNGAHTVTVLHTITETVTESAFCDC